MQNTTINLIRIIGSPFLGNKIYKDRPLSRPDINLLYDHAFENRVELLFLQRIKSFPWFTSEIEAIYKNLIEREKLTKSVAIRASSVLKNVNVPHVVFKSIKPYPATPNDTDILCFNPRKNYEEGLKALLKDGFFKLGEAPLQVCLSDPRGRGKVNLKKKGGTYYVDYYREIAADYIVYINQNSLLPFVKEEEINDHQISLLAKEPELAIVLFHNVFPERTFHLEHLYLCLYGFADPSFSFEVFKEFVKKNKLVTPIKANLTIIAYLHKKAFGNIPEPLLNLLKYWGEDKFELKRLKKNYFVPYNFSPILFWKTLLGKLQDFRTLRSLGRQIFEMIINPKFFIESIKSIKRRTFSDDIYIHQ